ncbi:hypothetical protein NIES2104_15740 [Leptolyngbya sp. NIES-2104]|nr:hypothetical protein NIES2104_15740 [Leptolyngbya sp. NIES-2104]
MREILASLGLALNENPDHLEARELKVLLMVEQLGAYEEALEEADELVRRAPNHAAYRHLRDRAQQLANAT